ncbi:ornithine cyclodeaminase family protein [Sphingomonas sp. So64.6b]|uniref:ornithine cyclodeaminase family protein n=1 Tax=Sphingomonas sp. So64.6b TaxID=2997354 RepID=UPI0016000783|nr:ornithine cyclodeaminase family protein [Sphingomonas sp. So64.6b]QNA86317.1 ornithine cyclodeaminase family protein [Sphingomonas sp. So64.6b]
MRIFSSVDVRQALDWPLLVTAVRDGFSGEMVVPTRHRHTIRVPGAADATLLVMPAWQAGHLIGVKLVTFFPEMAQRINAAYILFDGRTGAAIALIDGEELTARRTAATSVIAAQYLARPDARRIFIIGTGRLAEEFAAAYATMFPAISDIAIFGRSPERGTALVAKLRDLGLPVRLSQDIAGDAAAADIISCLTSASSPVLAGKWLSAGTHVDLVGGFTPDMREADDDVFRRATIVFADMTDVARREAGDLIGPLASGALRDAQFGGDLPDLICGRCVGRTNNQAITVFKSVGHASEDLAAASLLTRT